jgi:hypothetical protein
MEIATGRNGPVRDPEGGAIVRLSPAGSAKRGVRPVLRHLRSNVIAYLALFVAIGGTSYAAVSLPAGSVGTRQLRRGAVTLRKVSKQAQQALKGNRGPTGPKGPTGATGATGAAGATHVVTRVHTFNTGMIASGAVYINSVFSCNAGEHATGGGGATDQPGFFTMASSVPENDAGGHTFSWRTTWINKSAGSATANVNTYVVCASP